MHENEMALTSEELAELSDEALALIAAIREATDPAGDRGRQVSRTEGRRLLRAVTALGAQLALDILD